MGDPLDAPDFLAAALRQSREAIPDDGFSKRVAQRALAERRRMKWARMLPVAMALLGVALALVVTNAAAVRVGIGSLGEALSGMAPVPGLLAGYGLQPWMVVMLIGAVLFALWPSERDAQGGFRF